MKGSFKKLAKGMVLVGSLTDSSRSSNQAASAAASAAGSQDLLKQKKCVVWPEFTDGDINIEKWDVVHKGKEKDKSKSPVIQHLFDDPEGKVVLPPSLRVTQWKRPTDFLPERVPTIVDPEGMQNFDLLTTNEVAHESELIRWMTSQIDALWRLNRIPAVSPDPADPYLLPDGTTYSWRPWDHVYAISKVGKGAQLPQYNPSGKYCVRLFWMGCWRKITIDDTMPFDEHDKMLLPSTARPTELWPMLLAKALIKVAALDYGGGNSHSEFGDFNVIQCLTGWLPEIIPLQYSPKNEVWELLKSTVEEFKYPEPEREPEKQLEEPRKSSEEIKVVEERVEVLPNNQREKTDKTDKSKDSKKEDKVKGGKDAKERDNKKEKEKDKEKEKEREKHKEKSMPEEVPILPETPQVVVFASYHGPPKYPLKVSVLAELADASERLRQMGISSLHTHPVLISRTRTCPLDPPPPEELVPAWKLIRPRKKKVMPTDEPKEPEIEKIIQCVEVASPFVNYKVSPVPIPTDVHRNKSALARGGSRPSTSHSNNPIAETDENAPEPVPPEPAAPEPRAPEPRDSLKPPEPMSSIVVIKPSSSILTPAASVMDAAALTPKPGGKAAKKAASTVGASSLASSGPIGSPAAQSTASKRRSSTISIPSQKRESIKSLSKIDASKMDTSATDVKSSVQAISENGDVRVTPHTNVSSAIMDANAGKAKKVWFDFDMFCKCFQSLIIYHKQATYPCNFNHTDLKGTSVEERSPLYLFVDSLKPSEIVVSFSSLSCWNEAPPPKDKESHEKIKSRADKSDSDRSPSQTGSVSAHDDDTVHRDAPPGAKEALVPGTLTAEPHSWKTLVTGQPILRIRTTGTRAAMLRLPPGRHVLKFSLHSPLGHHVHLTSSTQFVFADEEVVMQHLVKESCRFVDNAVQIMRNIGRCIQVFTDDASLQQAWDELVISHCPYLDDENYSNQHHFEVFNEALYLTLRKCLGELSTAEMAYAWRVFTCDFTTKNILELTFTQPKPAAAAPPQRGSAKAGKKQAKSDKSDKSDKSETASISTPSIAQEVKGQGKILSEEDKTIENWANREPTTDEHVAAVKLQRSWRGWWTRKAMGARNPGTETNQVVQEQLLKAWNVLEQNLEQNALFLFRTLFRIDPDLMELYPFHKDEWNKIAYADYHGSYPEHQANAWFVVLRDVFVVAEPTLVVPKLQIAVPTCMLRVVDNDTGEELPKVFQKVAPHVFTRNKTGYTFVAEARAPEAGLSGGKWRLRLIGSLSPLPAPAKNEVNSSFNMREVRDYYAPNNKKTILRYSVRVMDDHLASIQLQTSKSDVYIRLAVFDNDEEVIGATGKGHVVLPAYIFRKDVQQEEERRSGSRTSVKGKESKEGRNSSPGSTRKKRSDSSKSEGRASGSSHSSETLALDAADDQEAAKQPPHHYVIQATVLRDSWPLSEAHWTFVQSLIDAEKDELKLIPPPKEQRPPSAATTASAPKPEKAAPAPTKTKAKGKEKGSKEKEKRTAESSRPQSQQFDLTKPHWILRFVSDAAAADEVDLRKDTSRADEVRAMKKAWEDAEPGRAAKALQSRLQYLNSHMIKVDQDDEMTGQDKGAVIEAPEAQKSPTPALIPEVCEPEASLLTLEPPPPPPPKTVLQTMDITPFIRTMYGDVRYLDEEEEARQLAEHEEEIYMYRRFREQVEEWRENDRKNRNLTKIRQLEMFEELQGELDQKRHNVFVPREAIRQKFLEAERLRLEEIAAQEAAMRAEMEKAAPPPKRGKSAKGKKSPGGQKSPAGKKKK